MRIYMRATHRFPRQTRSNINPFELLTNQTQELRIHHIAPTNNFTQQNHYDEEDKQAIP